MIQTRYVSEKMPPPAATLEQMRLAILACQMRSMAGAVKQQGIVEYRKQREVGSCSCSGSPLVR